MLILLNFYIWVKFIWVENLKIPGINDTNYNELLSGYKWKSVDALRLVRVVATF